MLLNQANWILKMAMNRREFLSRTVAVGGFGIGASVLNIPNLGAAETVKVIQQVDWIASSRYLGEVVAQSMGYFAESGLSLEITLGGPTNTGVSGVASGSSSLGLLSSSPTLMAARSGNIPLKCIAVGFQRHPLTFYSLSKNPIRTAKDMQGKRIGIAKSGFNLIQALMKQNGLADDAVKMVALAGDVAPLFNGQVDAIASWATDATKVKSLGADAVPLLLWDTGVELYANPYYATDKVIKERPDVLAGLMTGTAKGWAYAKENPEKAIDMLIKAYPSLDRESELAAVNAAFGYVFNKDTSASGWGTMTADNWARQLALFEAIGQFKDQTVPKVDDVMTMAILEMTKDKRPKVG
jgi:NitT/TauT family transport system substrate-binding protein